MPTDPPAPAHTMLAALALAIASFSGAAHATDGDLRSIAGMQHHSRVLLVFAPDLADARLKAQRQDFARAALRASERDLVLVQVGGATVIGAHDTADKLREKFKVPPAGYRTLLIGKDGMIALSVDGPVTTQRVEQAIDAMPMRQEELRRVRAGEGAHTN